MPARFFPPPFCVNPLHSHISIFCVVFLFLLVPPIEAVAILLKFFGYASFQHDHNTLVGGTLQILQYIPFLIYLLSPSLFSSPVFSSFYRYRGFIIYVIFHDAASGADYIADEVPRSWWWCMGNWICA